MNFRATRQCRIQRLRGKASGPEGYEQPLGRSQKSQQTSAPQIQNIYNMTFYRERLPNPDLDHGRLCKAGLNFLIKNNDELTIGWI